MKKVLHFPTGSILQFTCGQYSDFRTCGLLVAIKAINLPQLAQEYTGNGTIESIWSSKECDMDGFSGWLVSKGYAMPVDANQVHLGEYDDWADEFGVKWKED